MMSNKKRVIFVIAVILVVTVLAVYVVCTVRRKPERTTDGEEYNAYENYKENNEVHEGDVQSYELDEDINNMIEDIFKRNEESK